MSQIVDYLKKDFNKKIKINPRFSMRSYAKYLGVSPASLSNIMTSKSHVSPRVFNTIGGKLNLSPAEYDRLEKEISSRKKKSSIKYVNNDEMIKLKMAEFDFISDWHYYAILEIFVLDEYNESPEWIAGKLGIANIERIRESIEKLIMLGLLVKNKEGKLKGSTRFTSILDYKFSSTGMRERQKQILKLSSERIDLIPITERDHSGLTLTVDKNLLPEIKEKIKKFRRTLGNYIVKNSRQRNSVYELQISFIPLTLD